MKTLMTLTASAVFALTASTAFAGGPGSILKELNADREVVATKGTGCTGIMAVFPVSMIAESGGENCPDTRTERAIGVGIGVATAGVAVHAATGGAFPLFDGKLLAGTFPLFK